MKLSSRSRYGLRAILDLALEYGKGPQPIRVESSAAKTPFERVMMPPQRCGRG